MSARSPEWCGQRRERQPASLGGFVSGAQGNLTFSLTENDFSAATALISGGRIVDGAVTAGISAESDVQIFTREGRHVAGTLQGDSGRAALQAMMTEANGFNDGAVYVGDYLNGSGESGYLGIQTTARYDPRFWSPPSSQASDACQFCSARGHKYTNPIDGLLRGHHRIQHVGRPAFASIDAADIDGPGADDVAEAMLRELATLLRSRRLSGLPTRRHLPMIPFVCVSRAMSIRSR